MVVVFFWATARCVGNMKHSCSQNLVTCIAVFLAPWLFLSSIGDALKLVTKSP